MKTILVILTAGLFLVFGGCKKPKSSPITGGGKGGNGIISATPEHYGALLDSCTVYIKYSTLTAPVDGIYDDSVIRPLPIVNDSIPVAIFSHLKAGIYYIYCIGIHPNYGSVIGGKGFTLSKEDSENVIITSYSP